MLSGARPSGGSPGEGERLRGYAPAAAVVAALLLFTATVALGGPIGAVAPLVPLTLAVVFWRRALLSWHALLILMIGVILFIPIRRYKLPGSLPFELEPYRIVVALVLAAWLLSLLVDPRVRIRRTGYEGPLGLLLVAALGSVVVNPGRVASTSSEVSKGLTFLLSYLLILYLIASVAREREVVDRLLRTLVGGGAIVAVLALVETRTNVNWFDRLGGVIPGLETSKIVEIDPRGARSRAYASSQHPIALGAAFAMLVPMGIYLARTSLRPLRWWLACALFVLGAVATVSRTSILMLLVVGIMFFRLQPAVTKRVLPFLLPLMIVVQLAMPGSIGTIKRSFFPEGGLIADQRKAAGTSGSGRIADLGPALAEWSRTPLLGQGYGSRIVNDDVRGNADILDNQWLSTLLETGLVGVFAWLWLFVRSIRRLTRAARDDLTERSWLYAGLASSITAFAFGMLTFDAFSFIQVTFVLFLLVGLGAVLLAEEGRPAPVARRARLRAPAAERLANT